MNTDLVPQTGTMQSKSYDSLQLERSEKRFQVVGLPSLHPFMFCKPVLGRTVRSLSLGGQKPQNPYSFVKVDSFTMNTQICNKQHIKYKKINRQK